MLDQIFGGGLMGVISLKAKAKYMALAILLVGLAIAFIFAWFDMSDKYPAYARDDAHAPAYWTGLCTGLGVFLLYRTYLIEP
jgi:hypothetical protein